MSLQDRINEAIAGSGMTPADFARAVKVSQSAITQLSKGETKSLKADTAAYIEIATGYKATWLALGKGTKKVEYASSGLDPEGGLALIPPRTLRQTLERLAYFIGECPPDKRQIVGDLLGMVAKYPHDTSTLDALLPLMSSQAPD